MCSEFKQEEVAPAQAPMARLSSASTAAVLKGSRKLLVCCSSCVGLTRFLSDDTRYEIFKPGFVRVGVHFTMTQEEVDFVADAILWIADNGWKLLPSYTYKIMSGEWYHIKRDSHQMLK